MSSLDSRPFHGESILSHKNEPGWQTNSSMAQSTSLRTENHCPDHAHNQMLWLCVRTELETLSSESLKSWGPLWDS